MKSVTCNQLNEGEGGRGVCINIYQDAYRQEGNQVLQTLPRNKTQAEWTWVTCCLSRFGGNEVPPVLRQSQHPTHCTMLVWKHINLFSNEVICFLTANGGNRCLQFTVNIRAISLESSPSQSKRSGAITFKFVLHKKKSAPAITCKFNLHIKLLFICSQPAVVSFNGCGHNRESNEFPTPAAS